MKLKHNSSTIFLMEKESPLLLPLFAAKKLDCKIKMEAKFFRFLKVVGVGFKARAEAEGRLLYLKVGFTHEIELTLPPAVRVFCFKPNIICCTGLDKRRVHQFAAAVRDCKPPDVYKGKGILYMDEVVKKKQGKKSK
ncbi:large ribosomal subunit protein uL6m-like isoform X1 [Aristolochia californica]|uniref:large ribosomal subunit protein uL6m-like isoform X1 n=2 Tax=Aristolochia californica TaxID=171875 RepID=UPI0035E3B144